MAHVSGSVPGTSCFRNRRLTSPECCSRSRAWTKCKGWRPPERPNTSWIKCFAYLLSRIILLNFSIKTLTLLWRFFFNNDDDLSPSKWDCGLNYESGRRTRETNKTEDGGGCSTSRILDDGNESSSAAKGGGNWCTGSWW